MKKFFNFIFSGAFWLNILGIIVFYVLAVVVLMFSLKSCTRHGEAVTIPTIVGMDTEEAIAKLKEEGFNPQIIETLYIDSLPKGVVVEQNPTKESLVKPGRTVYLRVNTDSDIYIKAPNFVGVSKKMLESELKKCNLKLGKLSYEKDGEVVNVVLKQKYNGRDLRAGVDSVKLGSFIDFVIAGRDPSSKEEEEEEVQDNSNLFEPEEDAHNEVQEPEPEINFDE